jgi:hypothetical protein
MTDLALDEVAERLMRMDPTRPGVGRLAQEVVATVAGLDLTSSTASTPRSRLRSSDWILRVLP